MQKCVEVAVKCMKVVLSLKEAVKGDLSDL